MRRRAPRPLRSALEAVAQDAAPTSLLARAQAAWREVAGEAVAAESQPVAERGGTLTVRCSSAVWAQELALLAPDLRPALNAVLGPGEEVRELVFTVAASGSAGPPARDP